MVEFSTILIIAPSVVCVKRISR